jgi:hypothetical protein
MSDDKPLPVILGSTLLFFVTYRFPSLFYARREQICIHLISVLKLCCTFRLSSILLFASWHQFRNVKDPHLMVIGWCVPYLMSAIRMSYEGESLWYSILSRVCCAYTWIGMWKQLGPSLQAFFAVWRHKRSGNEAVCSLYLGTRSRWIVSFMLCPLFPRRKARGAHRKSGRVGLDAESKRKITASTVNRSTNTKVSCLCCICVCFKFIVLQYSKDGLQHDNLA